MGSEVGKVDWERGNQGKVVLGLSQGMEVSGGSVESAEP